MHNTLPQLWPGTFPAVRRRRLTTLQVNIGLRCNQACLHCHVNSSPYRTEKMDGELIDLIIRVLKERGLETLDITGGAPEMHPEFRRLVVAARELGVRVIDRCNLTILEEPGYEGLAEFLAQYEVEIIASLPCYSAENVDQQRGKGVFESSIAALQRLNRLGYGQAGSGLGLNLVYNPLGPSLPPRQDELQDKYKQELYEAYGIVFDRLFTLANMPINRFGSTLISHKQFDGYMTLLKDSHNDDNLQEVMCRDLVSVDWQGYLYDCDFNQMLGLHIRGGGKQGNGGGEEDKRGRLHLRDLLEYELAEHPVTVCDHCFACTAGQGSSCGGALTT
ncbi:MAG: arsenosugar biosynthesis radical SAM (seleno)protein ArsS [Pseudohongiellaceae bacterium]